MKSLSQVLNESFHLYEKTSDIRKFHIYQNRPPVWYDKTIAGKDNNSYYESCKRCYRMLAAYNKIDISKRYTDNFHGFICDKVEAMCKAYLEEYIDLKYVPCAVVAGMIESIINDPKTFKNERYSDWWILPIEMFKGAQGKAEMSVYESSVNYEYKFDNKNSIYIATKVDRDADEKQVRKIIDAEIIKVVGQTRFELLKNYKIILPSE